MCRYIADKKLRHGNRATVTRGTFKETSHDADVGAVTTVAIAVMLLMVVIGDCVLSVTSSQSCSSVELPVSTSRLNERVYIITTVANGTQKLCYCVDASWCERIEIALHVSPLVFFTSEDSYIYFLTICICTCVFHPYEMRRFLLTFSILVFSSTCDFSAPVEKNLNIRFLRPALYSKLDGI